MEYNKLHSAKERETRYNELVNKGEYAEAKMFKKNNCEDTYTAYYVTKGINDYPHTLKNKMKVGEYMATIKVPVGSTIKQAIEHLNTMPFAKKLQCGIDYVLEYEGEYWINTLPDEEDED